MATGTGLLSTASTVPAATSIPAIPAATSAPAGIDPTNSLTGGRPAATNSTPANVASVAAPAPVAPRTITDNETVAGQMNKLLSGDSEYMQSARSHALEQANQRGLINSSLAVQSGQRAAIDAAQPIAQQDANVYATAGQSAQNANQDLNQAGYNSLLASAQSKESFGYTTAQNQQNIDANVKLQNDRLTAEASLQTKLKQMDIDLDTSKLHAQQVQSLAAAMQPIQQQFQTEMSLIQRTPDEQLSQADKLVAIQNQQTQMKASVNALASLYGMPVTWPTSSTPVVSQGPQVRPGGGDSIVPTAGQGGTTAAPTSGGIIPTNGQAPAQTNTPPPNVGKGGTWMGGYYYLKDQPSVMYGINGTGTPPKTKVYDQTGKLVMTL